jgi:hypothetical protein
MIKWQNELEIWTVTENIMRGTGASEVYFLRLTVRVTLQEYKEN